MKILIIKSQKLLLLSVTTMDRLVVMAVMNVLHWSIYKCVLWLLCLIWYEEIALYRLIRFNERKRKYGNSDIGFISENTYACPYDNYEGDYYTGRCRDNLDHTDSNSACDSEDQKNGERCGNCVDIRLDYLQWSAEKSCGANQTIWYPDNGEDLDRQAFRLFISVRTYGSSVFCNDGALFFKRQR